ncbi:hypothetical protein L596_004460 [Steinernema carpocapsae]|uniref:Peptidase S1 domain-containing protein n=2 Tax=Steinernema carpocapsae TaxID=34508 RepID=A0A4U8UWZ2_STECR|nr:hypothetical protein L596_004460 [Steinernema carpocapsae]
MHGNRRPLAAVLLGLLATLSFGSATFHNSFGPNSRARRMINGLRASENDTNYMVHVSAHFQDGSASWCGGSLITDRLISTAAHCVSKPGNKEKILTSVTVSVNKLNTDEKRISDIDAVFIHPNYFLDPIVPNDLALVVLSEPVKLCSTPDFTFPVRLVMSAPDSSTSALNESTDCWLRGWGDNEEGRVSTHLLAMPLNGRRWFFKDLFRFATTTKTKACNGDSGGPVVCRLPDGKQSVSQWGSTPPRATAHSSATTATCLWFWI